MVRPEVGLERVAWRTLTQLALDESDWRNIVLRSFITVAFRSDSRGGHLWAVLVPALVWIDTWAGEIKLPSCVVLRLYQLFGFEFYGWYIVRTLERRVTSWRPRGYSFLRWGQDRLIDSQWGRSRHKSNEQNQVLVLSARFIEWDESFEGFVRP